MAESVARLSLQDSDNQISRLFVQAKEEFEQETHRPLDENFIRNFETVDQFVNQIKIEKEKFGSFREHEHPNLFKHVQLALKPIQLLSKIFAGPSGNVIFASGVVFNAVSYLIDCSDGVSLNYDTLEVLFIKIEDVSVDLDVLSRHELPKELREKVVELLIAIIKICSLSRKLIQQGRFLEYAKGVLRGRDPAVTQQLEIFDRLRGSLSGRVEALNYDTALRTKTDTGDIKATLQQQSYKEEEFRKEIRSKLELDKTMRIEDVKLMQTAKIAEVLQPSIKHRVLYNSFKASRAKQSGSWIINDPRYQSWYGRKFPILWISGGPGVGKSSLTSYVVEQLRNSLTAEPDLARASVVYFYFKESDRELRSIGHCLRTMASDIADNDPVFFKHTFKICNESSSSIQSISLLWEDIFQLYFLSSSCQSKAYLIFDGLDEANEQELEEFLNMLHSLQESDVHNLSVLLVGRPDLSPAMLQTFGELPSEIRVSSNTNNEDIELFVNESVPKLPHYKQMTHGLREEIRKTLIDRAGGMFLWVQLMLKELQPFYKSKNIRPILTKAPSSISDMIHHILERWSRSLKGDDLADFNEVLAWTTSAKRPFSVGELERLIQISNDDEENVELDQPLHEQFSSFFNVTSTSLIQEGGQDGTHPSQTEPKKLTLSLHDSSTSVNESESDSEGFSDTEEKNPGKADAKVNFNHASIRQYFQNGINTKVGSAGIEASESKIHVVKVLLKTIIQWSRWSGSNKESQTSTSDNDEEEEDQNDDDSDDNSSNEALIAYAASNWQVHLAALEIDSVPLEDKATILSSLVKLFRDRVVIRNWIGDVEDFPSKWLETKIYGQLTSNWLTKGLSLGLIAHDDAEWVASLQPDLDVGLLDTVMDVFAEEWLENLEESWNTTTIYQWLKTYAISRKLGGLETATQAQSGITPWSKRTGELVRRIARIYRSAETPMWHCRVAWVLRSLKAHTEAMKSIDLAIETDPKNWRYYSVKAKIFASQSDWEDAIETMNTAMEMLQGDSSLLKKFQDRYWANRLFLAQWHHHIEQYDKALEHFNACRENDPDHYAFITPMLRIMMEEGRATDVMKLLRELEAAKLPKSGHSRLVHTFLELAKDEDLNTDACFAASQCQELDLVYQTYEKALSEATRKKKAGRKAWLQFRFGVLRERFYYQRDAAIELWESIMTDSVNAVKGTSLFMARDWVIRDLCNVYTDEGSMSGFDSPEALKYLDKVKALCATYNDTSLSHDYDPNIGLGVLYRLFGNEEEAFKCFRGRVKLGIDLLSDNDPTNDWMGYYTLAREALVLAGKPHEKDCLAAYSLLGVHEETGVPYGSGTNADHPPVQRAPSFPTFLPSETTQFATAKTKTEWIFAYCDGCNKTFNIPDDTYVCTVCLDMNFCSDCEAKLKQSALGFRICSPKHNLVHIPVAPGPLPKGMVFYDGRPKPLQEWMGELKATWKL